MPNNSIPICFDIFFYATLIEYLHGNRSHYAKKISIHLMMQLNENKTGSIDSNHLYAVSVELIRTKICAISMSVFVSSG